MYVEDEGKDVDVQRTQGGRSTLKPVIPAAGLGLRFLPLTKEQTKEMLPIVDQKVYISDIQQATETLGWKPEISPEEGVKRSARRYTGEFGL